VPYYALARGFLTGKYRKGGPEVNSPRAGSASKYLDDRGIRVLGALDEISQEHDTTVAAVALAWLASKPTVDAPLASARNTAQLAELLPVGDLKLTDAELTALDDASA
jgi:aryl-alcohol dehydrogenase (NADP+)